MGLETESQQERVTIYFSITIPANPAMRGQRKSRGAGREGDGGQENPFIIRQRNTMLSGRTESKSWNSWRMNWGIP